ncbi:hypothetical protein C6558_24235 [Ensifer sp. NM-2]|uniref:molybdopterin-binding protein n=1 Tax=Ensifer sp. NM-2 TaxID=2109730 RepID=UPI000D442D84|nr:molybdopterin-binding protein [Ensifer sp. NM-2]PSS61912.1 hypothetical protein C6558_24235 [Ensifer sp. NM-2]
MLAHSFTVESGRYQKGHRITSLDVMTLSAAGVESLVVARLEKDDVEENDAAGQIADLLTQGHLRNTSATTGRVNIHSAVSGLFTADCDIINRLNRLDAAITIACLADHSPVRANDIVASVKIVPFAVSRQQIEQARRLASLIIPFEVKPFLPHRVALIATTLPSLKQQTLVKTRTVLAERLTRHGSSLDREWRVGHDESEIAAAIEAALPDHDLVIIFGASAVADPHDVLPTAIRRAGGVVEHVGMPVDPGNLLVLGRVNEIRVIGAPGCARSPRHNGLDLILHRVLAGEYPTSWDVMGLGVGGLLAT